MNIEDRTTNPALNPTQRLYKTIIDGYYYMKKAQELVDQAKEIIENNPEVLSTRVDHVRDISQAVHAVDVDHTGGDDILLDVLGDDAGSQPIHWVSALGYLEMVKLFVNHMTPESSSWDTTTDANKQRPYDLALREGYKKVGFELLKFHPDTLTDEMKEFQEDSEFSIRGYTHYNERCLLNYAVYYHKVDLAIRLFETTPFDLEDIPGDIFSEWMNVEVINKVLETHEGVVYGCDGDPRKSALGMLLDNSVLDDITEPLLIEAEDSGMDEYEYMNTFGDDQNEGRTERENHRKAVLTVLSKSSFYRLFDGTGIQRYGNASNWTRIQNYPLLFTSEMKKRIFELADEQNYPILHDAIEKRVSVQDILEYMIEYQDHDGHFTFIETTNKHGRNALVEAIHQATLPENSDDLNSYFDPLIKELFVATYGLSFEPFVPITDMNGLYVLHFAAEISLPLRTWTKEIIEAGPKVLAIHEYYSGLLPFMLAAVGSDSDLSAIFFMLREKPDVLVDG